MKSETDENNGSATAPTAGGTAVGAPPPEILVVGTGAVGGYYGAQLARAGASVSTVHRSDHAAVAKDGIHIDGMKGAIHFTPKRVLKRVGDYPGHPDYILVCMKVLPEAPVAAVIRPAVGPDTVIVLLQNGIEIEPPVAEAFPGHEILSGLAFICVSRTGPGQISHTCYGRLTIGRYPQGESVAAQRLAALFEAVGTPCRVSRSVVTDRWRKLVWNAPFNPISVLLRADTREILQHPETARLVKGVMEEVARLAAAAGYPLPEHVVEKNLQDTRVMKPYRTSMLLDHLAGRRLEVEAILGNAVAAARRCGVDVPRLETLYGLLSLADRRPGDG